MKGVKPIALEPGRSPAPDPISLQAGRSGKPRIAGPFRLWQAVLAAVVLGLAAAGWKYLSPAPALFCYPPVQTQGCTLEFKYHANARAEDLHCEFAGDSYPFYPSGNGEFRALAPVKLFAKPAVYYAVVRERTAFGEKVRARVPVAVRRGKYPHASFTLHIQSRHSREDRDMLIASARQILLQTLARKDPAQLWSGHFIYPLRGRISAAFGERRTVNGKPGSVHYGVDIAAPAGTDIVAANTGLVALTGDFPLQGKIVLLSHGQGVFSAYLHMSEIAVREGDVLKQGQLVGRTGSTGRSTGPHLHWGAYVHGVPVNPLEWVERSL